MEDRKLVKREEVFALIVDENRDLIFRINATKFYQNLNDYLRALNDVARNRYVLLFIVFVGGAYFSENAPCGENSIVKLDGNIYDTTQSQQVVPTVSIHDTVKSDYKLENRSTERLYKCPKCRKERVFVRYITKNGTYIADDVGECDRKRSCGYYYEPERYFKNHSFPLEKGVSSCPWYKCDLASETQWSFIGRLDSMYSYVSRIGNITSTPDTIIYNFDMLSFVSGSVKDIGWLDVIKDTIGWYDDQEIHPYMRNISKGIERRQECSVSAVIR
jgi:hypothetical protein